MMSSIVGSGSASVCIFEVDFANCLSFLQAGNRSRLMISELGSL